MQVEREKGRWARSSTPTSKYMGVCYDQSSGLWRSTLSNAYCKTEKEAAADHDKCALRKEGPAAMTNAKYFGPSTAREKAWQELARDYTRKLEAASPSSGSQQYTTVLYSTVLFLKRMSVCGVIGGRCVHKAGKCVSFLGLGSEYGTPCVSVFRRCISPLLAGSSKSQGRCQGKEGPPHQEAKEVRYVPTACHYLGFSPGLSIQYLGCNADTTGSVMVAQKLHASVPSHCVVRFTLVCHSAGPPLLSARRSADAADVQATASEAKSQSMQSGMQQSAASAAPGAAGTAKHAEWRTKVKSSSSSMQQSAAPSAPGTAKHAEWHTKVKSSSSSMQQSAAPSAPGTATHAEWHTKVKSSSSSSMQQSAASAAPGAEEAVGSQDSNCSLVRHCPQAFIVGIDTDMEDF